MTATTHKGSGRVADVFNITGRGVVVALKDLEGVFHIGDIGALGDADIRVAGIEMIRPRKPTPPHDKIALLLAGIDIDQARAAIGTRVVCHAGAE
ncbi:hypothetical protein V8J82_06100 [Gymnodinialimonas sp. 2305UL16-5]|uniref:hypothetical protein n=1 Tax=Gymnodinialimonas mytili TaxID=3126503 RepID=UPI003095BA80